MPKKKLTGKVVSIKMQKTAVVNVEMPKKHAIYRKSIKNTQSFKARNTTDAKSGDLVIIEESKPFSKDVRWQVLRKVEE